jgi:hypothetical protein
MSMEGKGWRWLKRLPRGLANPLSVALHYDTSFLPAVADVCAVQSNWSCGTWNGVHEGCRSEL